MSKILIFGPAETVETLSVPAVGGDGEGIRYETVLAGAGETLAVTVARLGGRAVFAGRVGDDSGGKRLVRLLDTVGADLSCIRVDRSAQTGHAVRECDSTGRCRVIRFPGANARLTEEEVRTAFQSSPDAVCLAGDLPHAILGRIGEIAAERAVPLFYLYRQGSTLLEELPYLEIFMTDDDAAEELTGIRPSGTDSCLSAAIALGKRFRARYFVIRLGERGAFVYDGTYCYVVNSFIVPATDPRGAAEVFFGAAVCEYMRDPTELLGALRYAAAVSAVSETHEGEAVSPPTADEVMGFLERNG